MTLQVKLKVAHRAKDKITLTNKIDPDFPGDTVTVAVRGKAMAFLKDDGEFVMLTVSKRNPDPVEIDEDDGDDDDEDEDDEE